MRGPSPTSCKSSRATEKALAAPANSSGSATFSSAVMVGTRWNDWNTMPISAPRISASSSSLSWVRSWPATLTPPLVARSRPATTISSDVLPEPDGPTTASDWPSVTSRLTLRRISTGPARLVRVSCTVLRATIGWLTA